MPVPSPLLLPLTKSVQLRTLHHLPGLMFSPQKRGVSEGGETDISSSTLPSDSGPFSCRQTAMTIHVLHTGEGVGMMGVEKTGVEKMGVEKTGVEKMGVEKTGMDSLVRVRERVRDAREVTSHSRKLVLPEVEHASVGAGKNATYSATAPIRVSPVRIHKTVSASYHAQAGLTPIWIFTVKSRPGDETTYMGQNSYSVLNDIWVE
ncbi:hypothetical protein K439DRAFT_1663317 [Ramaria rubella]|nr:hypothetical protein K439DRAFT_1663317 [Ramaria rubella]